MAKVEAVGIRVGNLLEWNKRVWRVIKCYHVHVGGRGGAFMQVEMKDIEVGTKTNQRFRTEDKVERAFVDPREMQYLYQDGDSFIFMDQQNYEQLSLSAEFLEGQSGYLLPNAEVQVNFYDGRPIGVELPPSVVLTVVETEPGITFRLHTPNKLRTEPACTHRDRRRYEQQSTQFELEPLARHAVDFLKGNSRNHPPLVVDLLL